ncbi:MAG: DEAD/DEAH box helicase [Lewinellaceae bacterium]|nr:DEAD/DEAH box helicase [Lewinellaceae bacterium]
MSTTELTEASPCRKKPSGRYRPEPVPVGTIFPTGGGKSITFQVPALMSYQSMKALTVVISPLQSLMKDQVDNLERAGITEAPPSTTCSTPSNAPNPSSAWKTALTALLYISPESLRSKSIERLLLPQNRPLRH